MTDEQFVYNPNDSVKPSYYEKTVIFDFPNHGRITITVHMDSFKNFECAWMWIHTMIDNMSFFYE